MDTQETRTARITISVTPSELSDARLVAGYLNTDLSNLLRDYTMAQVAEKADAIRALPLGSAA